ncbi:hypothetical protein ACFY0N_30865 [Streptomyces vinaceus]|uniref:hypothetical protein n=1 Tax=Streptomyces vinaceus TaxID=1960 RepID=UPI0036CDE9F3
MSETRDEIIERVRREGVSPNGIRELRTMAQPMPVAEIAKLFGISRGGVYFHINGDKRQLGMGSREKARALRPFQVPTAMQKCNQYNQLSAHILYHLDPTALSKTKQLELEGWWRGLRGVRSLILVFDPEQEPNEVAKCGGWAFDERTPEDGSLVVRPHGEITEEQRAALTLEGL